MVVPWLQQSPGWGFGLVAQAGGAARPGIWESPLFWTSLALVGALLLGALIIALVDRWRKRPVQNTSPAGEQLSHFRSLYDRGEISREEFERIRALLGGRLREQLQVPPPKAEGPPAAGQRPAEGDKPPAEPPAPPPPGA
jgi:hypothetical protein